MSWKRPLIAEAKKLIEMYPEKRSALGPLLYLALREDGYISNDSIKQISELIGITEVQVHSVSTFYSMYKQNPVGKYLVSVCKSISCEISGSNSINKELMDVTNLNHLETDEEGMFTIEKVECIGACGGAPAVQVNYETVEGVTPPKALELCKYLKEEVPEVIVADDLQEKFGGIKSFDCAIEDNSGTSSTAPGFQIIGTSEEK